MNKTSDALSERQGALEELKNALTRKEAEIQQVRQLYQAP